MCVKRSISPYADIAMEKLLQKAIKIATEAHNGQVDKAGAPYIEHALRVMAAGETYEEKILGVLHDVVEDTEWTFEALAAQEIPAHIIAALRHITRHPDEPYEKFIARVKKNALATAVKLHDLTDNMDIRRLPYLSDKDVKRLKRYLKAYKRLNGENVYSQEAAKAEYPNAFKPWEEAEDTALRDFVAEQLSYDEIAEHFQRKRGAIISRIKHLKIDKEE